jgi:ATP-dependent Lon protease
MFKYDNDKSSLHLPLLPLRDIVVYPHMVAPLFVGRTQSVNALTEAMNKEKQIFLATQKSAGIDDPKEKDISSVGTIGNVLQLLRLPDGTVKALVEGKQRGQIKRFIPNEDYFQVEIEMLTDGSISKAESVALMRAVNEAFEEYAKQNTNISKDLISNVAAITDPSQLADTVSAHFSFKLEDKQKLLEIRSLTERLSLLLRLIKMEIEIFRMDKRIKGRVKDQMEKTQRNYSQ